ncbi:MAG: hypothetical protein JO134_16370 [Xanthobacteraceae bacterium]|nr:hypothetical protein [Xanthobacteraceae bacterium]
MMKHSAMIVSLKHGSIAIKNLRKQYELLSAYQLSPWLVYPMLVILRETMLGLRRFSFDWLGGSARLSAFEPGSITLAVAFTLAFCAGYVILYVRGPQKLPLVLIMSVAASIMYFGLEYFIVNLDLHLLPGGRNACANSASGPYCLGYFELGMLMCVSVMVSINGCRWALQRLGNQTYSWELPTRPDMKNAGPLSGVRQGTAWGLVSTAARFIVGALLLSFMIGILAGLAQSIWKLPQTDNFDLQLKIAAISIVETILLLAAIAAGRIVGAGSIKAGLGNKAVSKPLLMILLALVLVGYEALATYLLFEIRPDLLLLESHPLERISGCSRAPSSRSSCASRSISPSLMWIRDWIGFARCSPLSSRLPSLSLSGALSRGRGATRHPSGTKVLRRTKLNEILWVCL